MSPRHHPSEATLMSYGSGALGEGLALVVASHLAFCPDCRAALADAECLGGALLEALAPAPLAPGARERALALVAQAPPAPWASAPPRLSAAAADPVLPAPVRRYLGTGSQGLRWRVIAPGLSQCEIVPRDLMRDGTPRLMRIAKGKKLPRHGHTGTELTLVLKGTFSDATGRFARGDLAETDDALVHEPVSGREEDCICLVATDGRLKFDSAIARMFQHFAGF